MCKPHKHGWAPKKKFKTKAKEIRMDREIAEVPASSDNRERIK